MRCFTWKQIVSACAGILTVIALITFGSNFVVKVDTRWAYAEDFNRLEQRVGQGELVRRLDQVDARLWTLDDRYYGRVMPLEVREQIRDLKKEKKGLETELKKAYKK